MKIAIYYPWIYLTSGVERVILEIVKRGKHDYTIFTNHYDKENTYPEFKNLKVVELNRVSVKRDLFSVAKVALIITLQKIELKDYDLLFVHTDGLGDLILTRNRDVPAICFCHTPLRPVFDKHYRDRVIKRYNGSLRLLFNFFSSMFRVLDIKIWRNYKYVFFNSYETLSRAKNGGLLENLRGKYEILHPGIDWRKIRPTWIYKPYFLSAGRIMWTKNIELGIASFIKFKKLSQIYENFELVIAGQVDKKSKPYLKMLHEMVAKRKDIKFIISPSEERLKKLYSECRAVIFTSFNEDFGMILLEGNAYGKPVIALNRGGPKESQIDGKTGYLAPEDAGEIAEKMKLLARDVQLAIKLGKSARENSKKYDWNRFVEALEQTFEKVISKA